MLETIKDKEPVMYAPVMELSERSIDKVNKISTQYISCIYTERRIYLGQRKFGLAWEPKRVFVCNKKYLYPKCLLLYFKGLLFKGPFLKSKKPDL